jgi:hypothetical protein
MRIVDRVPYGVVACPGLLSALDLPPAARDVSVLR